MYHWKQTAWNTYQLIGPICKSFKSYEELYTFCKNRGINATQV